MRPSRLSRCTPWRCTWLGRSDGPAVLTISALFAIVIVGCMITGTGYDGAGINGVFVFLSAFWAIAATSRRFFGGLHPSMIFQGFAAFAIMSLLTTLASAILAEGSPAYIDRYLVDLDIMIAPGFDWRATMMTLPDHLWLLTLLSYAYVSLNWQPLLFFGALLFLGSEATLARFMAAWSFGLLACVVAFHWLPAEGAYVHYGIAMRDMPGMLVSLPWDYPAKLQGFRSGAIDTLSAGSVVGLVTVPSFHACAAILLGWGFSRLKYLGKPMVAINLGMLISAVPIGGHYLVDVVAGALIAVIGIGLSAFLVRRDTTHAGVVPSGSTTGPPIFIAVSTTRNIARS